MGDGLFHLGLVIVEEAGAQRRADGQHLEAHIGVGALVEDIEGRVVHIGDGGLAGLAALGELQIEDDALHGVLLAGHVGEEVTQAVGHEAFLLFALGGLHGDHFHGADHVAVAAQNHIHAILEE